MSKREIAGTVAVLIAVAAFVAVAMRTADNVRAGMERADCAADELLRSIKEDQASDLRGYTIPELPKPRPPRQWGVEIGDATGRVIPGVSFAQGDNPIIGSELIPGMVGIAWAPPQP